MKRPMILACLVTTLSMPAYAGAFGPPADLTVNQMPRVAVPQVDDDILTPLPGEDSALPKLEKPQPAPAKLLGLTPSDRVTPLATAPPQPTPIREEEKPRIAESYGPATPPQPALEKVSFMPGTAIPFPPSADDWSARMPLAAKAPSHEAAKPEVKTAKTDIDDDQPPAPQRPSRHSSAARVSSPDDDNDFDRPRRIVVRANGDSDGECRSYTRNVSDGRRAEGTACRGSDGVWRIEDEHLVTHMRVARIYHVNSAPYHTGALAYHRATGIGHLGLALGSFWHFR